MKINERTQTLLTDPHLDSEGVIAFRLANEDREVHLIYSVAQQAMFGDFFKKRYLNANLPYAEFIDIGLLPSPVDDSMAKVAADWLLQNAQHTKDNGVAWLHNFDLVYVDGDIPIYAPWLSGVGQANALLACVHWWNHTHDPKWRELIQRALVPFIQPLSTEEGLCVPIGSEEVWFEEYPAVIPSHVLNCHLLSLLVLDCVARTIHLPIAEEAFNRGWNALKRRIHLYDRKDWSRYDLYNRMFTCLRLCPSRKGVVALRKVELLTNTGLKICQIDATNQEPCDLSISRLAGIDWGQIGQFNNRSARVIPYKKDYYLSNIPAGGTDQNTYLIFEEMIPAHIWAEHGLHLKLEIYMDSEAELLIEFRDPRYEAITFRNDSNISPLKKEGWNEFTLSILSNLIGKPLSRHYHRLHAELLGTLLTTYNDSILLELFNRWYRGDFHDIAPVNKEPLSPIPKNFYVFTNSKCNLHCSMCDIGVNDKSAMLSRHMTQQDANLNPSVVIKALQQIGGDNVGDINFLISGTEPLVSSNYYELLKEVKKLGIHTGITTNGLSLSKEAERLSHLNLDQLILSIDGTPEIHDKIRGCPGLFKRIGDGLFALRQACQKAKINEPKLDISFTISYDNHKSILDFLNAVRFMRPRAVIFSHLNFVPSEIASKHNLRYPYYPTAPSSVEAWIKSKEMGFMELFFQLEEALKTDWTEIHIIPYCPTPTRLQWYYTKPELLMSRSHCAAPWNCIQVLCDGTVTILGRCFSIIMGDLNKEDIDSIWLGKKYQDFREFIISNPSLEPCLRCCGSL